MAKPVEIYDTTLRDSTHTLRKSPLRKSELLPLAELMDDVGFPAVEVWGGATVDVCLRQLNEDPWDRLLMFAERFNRTALRVIARGQNLLGYRPQPIDVIKAFAREVALKGIKIVRVFDSLNDIDNLEPVIDAFLDVGMTIEGALVYTQSPVHSTEGFVVDARKLVELGCRKIVIADNSGILTPANARVLIEQISAFAPVLLHARAATGMASMAYMAAVEAGAAGIDCTIAPFGLYSTLPSVEAMVESLSDAGFANTIDTKALRTVSKRAEAIVVQHAMSQADRQMVESAVSVHKISIGMLSGLIQELKNLNARDRLGDVLAEVTRVREDFGWPPLITPMSQMVADQAIHNVFRGKRYSIMSREVKDYLKGMYGRPPGEINPELMNGITPISGRASALLAPVMEEAEAMLKREGLYQRREDVITYAQFGRTALEFFRIRKDPSKRMDSAAAVESPNDRLELLTGLMEKRGLRKLEVSGEGFRVKLVKRGKPAAAVRSDAPFEAADSVAAEPELPEETKGIPVTAPLSGIFYRASAPGQPAFAEPGVEVEEESVIGLIEAMKLFHEVKAQRKGKVKSFAVENGVLVEQNQPIAFLEE